MQINPTEIERVATATALPTFDVPRVDLYAGIHKALRAFMSETLLSLGRADPRDDQEIARAAQGVEALMALFQAHLEHENAFLHPAIEACAPGTSAEAEHHHGEQQALIRALATRAQALPRTDVLAREPATLRLYQDLSAFVADNLQHMLVEETVHNAALWTHHTDEELTALHGALVASIEPAEMMAVLRWLVPYMNPAERLGLLQGMRQNAPAPVFDAVMNHVQPHLSAREWEKLHRGLGLTL